MAESPLTKKLQVKAGYRMTVIHPPQGYTQRLDPLPEGVEMVLMVKSKK